MTVHAAKSVATMALPRRIESCVVALRVPVLHYELQPLLAAPHCSCTRSDARCADQGFEVSL